MAREKRKAVEDPNRESNGRFTKGNSANPGGRPKGEREIREMCQKLSPDVIDRLGEIVKTSNDMPAVTAASKIILERAYGKAMQRVSVKEEVSKLSNKELLARAREIVLRTTQSELAH